MNKSQQKRIIDRIINLSETTPFSIDDLLNLADRIASLASTHSINLDSMLNNLKNRDH